MPKKKKRTKAKTTETHKHEEVKLAPVPKRIRINFSGANQQRSFSPGETLRVPEDVPADVARKWLKAGKAMEDKAGKEPAEVKAFKA